MKLKDYLLEAVYDSGPWADATDNFPPSTVIFGEKMTPKEIDSVNGKIVRFECEPDFKYGEWRNSDGMDNPKHFHKSIFGLNSIIKRSDFYLKKNMKKKPNDVILDPMEPDGPIATLNPQQKDTDGLVAKDEVKPNTKKNTTVIRIGDDTQEFYRLDIDKLVKRHI